MPLVRVTSLHPRFGFDEAVEGLLTLGVEEEHLLIDPYTSDLAPVAPEILLRADRDRRIVGELRQSQIELATRVCATAPDVEREIRSARSALASVARGLARPVAAGVHPTVSSPGPVTESPRYRTILENAPWSARELLTCGMHVHVGVAGAERALAVYDALRSYLPLLIAVGANSPFYGGEDAGVASVRAKLNATNPRHGVPPAFGSWAAFERYLHWGAAAGVVADPSYHWFDLRLNPSHGTIEVRAFDVQTDPGHAVSLASLTHALVAWLASRYDEGEELPVHESHLITESSFLAARDGTTGSIVDLDNGKLIPTVEASEELMGTLRPFAVALGSERSFDGLHEVLALSGAERQRVVASGIGFDGLVDWLARETVAEGNPAARKNGGRAVPGRVHRRGQGTGRRLHPTVSPILAPNAATEPDVHATVERSRPSQSTTALGDACNGRDSAAHRAPPGPWEADA
jgi:carboxylate-amine ligase